MYKVCIGFVQLQVDKAYYAYTKIHKQKVLTIFIRCWINILLIFLSII